LGIKTVVVRHFVIGVDDTFQSQMLHIVGIKTHGIKTHTVHKEAVIIVVDTCRRIC